MPADGGAMELSRFLGRLADKHSEPDIVFSLRVAQSALRVLAVAPPEVPAMAVIGPTQTGKSTVVNLLAAGRHVETSALAAHTQRAAALVVNSGGQVICPAIGDEADSLHVSVPGAPACVIWDTPDFDSNASMHYRQQVALLCGCVDLVVMVVSKEKYADRSLWRVLEILAPLETPTVLCLNKSEPDDDGETRVLLDAIRRRIRDNVLVSADVALLKLPRMSAAELEQENHGAGIEAFRAAVFQALRQRRPPSRAAGAGALLRANRAQWIAPIERELACQRDWQASLAAAADTFMARYRCEYIHHARHHDVARKAVLGLLDLLEIPYLAGSMSRVRRALTWPIRRLAGALGRPAMPGRDQEIEVLQAAMDHCLLALRGEALTASQRHPWWRALSAELAAREPALRREFQDEVEQYRAAFQPRIDRLSRDLYEQLKDNPLTLNTLRAARVSVDAGGIVLAVKTGTLGLYDALLAPAVVSLTSYLTESAVGQYLRTVIGRLKEDQLEQVESIVRDIVEGRLGAIQPQGPELFGISEAELDCARALMRELES